MGIGEIIKINNKSIIYKGNHMEISKINNKLLIQIECNYEIIDINTIKNFNLDFYDYKYKIKINNAIFNYDNSSKSDVILKLEKIEGFIIDYYNETNTLKKNTYKGLK